MELISKEKTLKELYGEGVISVRTFNSLNHSLMKTIGDVVDYINQGKDLKSIKNLGMKSEYELLRFLSTTRLKEDDSISTEEEKYRNISSEERETFESSVKDTICPNSKVSSYIFDKVDDIPTFYFWLYSHTDGIIETIHSFSREENVIFRQHLANILHRQVELLRNYEGKLLTDSIAKSDAIKKSICDNINRFTFSDEFLLSSPLCKKYIEERYSHLVSSLLNVRAKHLIERYGVNSTALINLFDKPLTDYSCLCPGASNRKTLSDIFIFNKEFRKIVEKCIGLTDTEIKEHEIKSQYPYLSCRQREFVKGFIASNGRRPILYLLYNYLRLSEDRTDKLYSLFHGIFDDCSHSLEEIGKAFEITRERARQIVFGEIPAVNEIKVTGKEKEHYREVFSAHVVTEDSTAVSDLMESEHLNCGFNVFAALVQLITDLTIYSPYKSIEILVDERSIDKQILKSSILLLENVTKGRYSKDTEFNLNDILTCDDIQKKQLISFLSYIALAEFGIEVDEFGNFTMSQNCVDIEDELYKILLFNDKALHLDELFVYFKKKYPNHKYTEAYQLRSYLKSSDRIGSIGKTSTYALKDRSDIFFGSIRDLIYSTLDKADDPVAIVSLTNKVKAFYPKTSQSSIESTMQSDTLNRFVAYEGGFYGLTSKKYYGDWKRAQQYRRLPFEERIKNYASFVEEYHRLPSAGANNDEEASLGRWKQNVESSVITLTIRQRQQFDDMLQDFLDKGYPRSLIESEFLNNCYEYKNFIYNQHNLPTLKDGKELYEWFRRSLSNFDGYADLRYKYFSDLLNFITSLGFVINRGRNAEL